eukprot:g6439.t1
MSAKSPFSERSQIVPPAVRVSDTPLQSQYHQSSLPPSPPGTTSYEYFYQPVQHTAQQQAFRRNLQLDDLKYQLERSLQLLRRELDNRIERVETEVGRARVETNKLRGIAFLREEDHMRILSSIQQIKETNAMVSNNNISFEQKLKHYPNRNEIDTLLLSTIDPLKSELNTKVQQLSKQLNELNNIYLKVEKEIKRQAKNSHNNDNSNNASNRSTENSDGSNNNDSAKNDREYIIEQVEARLFHRLEKMIVDRVDLISLRSQNKLFDKFSDALNNKISKVIESETKQFLEKNPSLFNGKSNGEGGRRWGLLLNEQDVYHKKQYNQIPNNGKYAEERLIMKDSMKQIGKEQKLMQNSLISIRTQVRALARVVSSLKCDVSNIMQIQHQNVTNNDIDNDHSKKDSGEVVPLSLYHSR